MNPEDFDFNQYLAWCWLLVKTTLIVLSVALNVVFILILLGHL